MAMTNPEEFFPQRLSRRDIVKGLAGLTLVLASTGCTSSASPPANLTPISTQSTPSPTSAVMPTPTTSPTPTPITVTRRLLTYRGHTAAIYAVGWHGTRIVSGSEDRTAQVWNADTGSHILTYTGHSDVVSAVTWSPDGGRIASGSGDRTAQVWDAATGSRILTYRGHSWTVTDVEWSPDGTRIASASLD